MTPKEFVQQVITPGAAWAEQVAGLNSSIAARRMLLAIAIQESDLVHRYQMLPGGAPGPARSWWQGEQTGGMIRVVTASAVSQSIRSRGVALCQAACVRPEAAAIWRAIEGHDLLAYGLARLLLLSDPQAIPETEPGAWACYADRLWRPGKPHRERWITSWAAALREYPLG
ncbi:hypothetical protein ACFFMP_08360 [Pseudoroseomonas cervicalis]|uniref:Uncharacterized protein n=1 Tax=Pseudoroseomonas cervicalis ATCC 49957 TaxID=525371 RepID=D5RTD6_9PROT|nr:hypothetical protein [Pseudoroseomonas cervicalis]EFH09428.1 hypothetical protein HMPREF0731_4348 [Pseudoroseomonas cervicalis ATCC 49957]